MSSDKVTQQKQRKRSYDTTTVKTSKSQQSKSKRTKLDKNTSDEKTNVNAWTKYDYDQLESQHLQNQIRSYDPNIVNNKTNKQMLGWVSATMTKNHLLDDMCSDWLEMYYQHFGITDHELTHDEASSHQTLIKDDSHINVLFQSGNEFENRVYRELKELFGDNFVQIFDDADMKVYREERSLDGILSVGNKKVQDMMFKGIPLIAQAPLINYNNNTYGVADILIRSDYLAILFASFDADPEIAISAPKLSTDSKPHTNYHYRVIDIKWTTMNLCVDGITIRNDGRFSAYKGQVAMYTVALGKMQGYTPNYGYILAKGWKIDKSNISSSDISKYRGYGAFDRPGIICYTGRDSVYIEKTKEAIKWRQLLELEGHKWRYGLTEPTITEMYPNMSRDFTPKFSKIKEIIACRYGDPTLVWYVTAKNRKILHSSGIKSIADEKCTAKTLGLNDSAKRGAIIDNILDINRQEIDLVRPLRLPNIVFDTKGRNLSNWKPVSKLDYYVDFETINYNVYMSPDDVNLDNNVSESDATFMIGLWFEREEKISSENILNKLGIDGSKYNFVVRYDPDTKHEFVNLVLLDFTMSNELEIFRLFHSFILIRREMMINIYNLHNSIRSKLYHWTGAEIRFFESAVNRIISGKYIDQHMKNPTLTMEIDGKTITKEKELKHLEELSAQFSVLSEWIDMYKLFESVPIVVKNAYRFKLKKIGNAMYKNKLIATHWPDGAMSDGFVAMMQMIQTYRQGAIDLTAPKLVEVIDYNQIDCKVIWEIVTYLRCNHCIRS